MRKTAFAAFALLLLALPQVAQAQSFVAKYRYTAKVVCGPGSTESGAGVVPGHYNTTVNIESYRHDTVAAFRATALAGTLDVNFGVPSGYSPRLTFDRDEAFGLQCFIFKALLGVVGQNGSVEGFLNIYSNRPLDVVSVVTAEGFDGVSSVQMLEAGERPVSETIEPFEFD